MIRLAIKTAAWHPTEQEWLLAANTISKAERARIAQFVFKRDAKHSMAGRLLMRSCFSELTGDPPRSFVLDRDDHGKPVLVGPPSALAAGSDNPAALATSPGNRTTLDTLSFNVSHAGDYAVFVACPSAKVGVDVMKVELRRNTTPSQFFSHMTRQFTESEWQAIRAPASEQQQLFNFYRHWCLKESYVKTIGSSYFEYSNSKVFELYSNNTLTV